MYRKKPLLGLRRLVGALVAACLGLAASFGIHTRSRKAATDQSADKAAPSKEKPLALVGNCP